MQINFLDDLSYKLSVYSTYRLLKRTVKTIKTMSIGFNYFKHILKIFHCIKRYWIDMRCHYTRQDFLNRECFALYNVFSFSLSLFMSNSLVFCSSELKL